MRTSIALSATLLLCAPALAADTGELWEVTSLMTMEGMPPGMVPARTSEVCTDPSWSKPPVAVEKDRNCEIVGWTTTATVSTWKMHCAGPPAMVGNGEITRTAPDAYKGFIQMSSPQGAMKINLTGRKIGACDAQAARVEREARVAQAEAQAAAAQKMVADVQEQSCMAIVQGMDPKMLQAQAATCDPAKYKPLLCERASSDEGFKTLLERKTDTSESGFAAITKDCGIDVAAKQKELCDKAASGESDLDFLAKNCPEQAAAIAQRECSGRDYTAMRESKYGRFCGTYAATHGTPGASPAPESTKTKAKKTLKSLFGK